MCCVLMICKILKNKVDKSGAIHYALKQHQLNTKLILQVHDELLFDVPKTELESAQKLILTAMENAMKLPNQVPVVASLGYGNNWLEAH